MERQITFNVKDYINHLELRKVRNFRGLILTDCLESKYKVNFKNMGVSFKECIVADKSVFIDISDFALHYLAINYIDDKGKYNIDDSFKNNVYKLKSIEYHEFCDSIYSLFDKLGATFVKKNRNSELEFIVNLYNVRFNFTKSIEPYYLINPYPAASGKFVIESDEFYILITDETL